MTSEQSRRKQQNAMDARNDSPPSPDYDDHDTDIRSGPELGEQELEVEYDVNPTQLFELIEGNQWEDVLDHLQSVPLESKTWIVSKRDGQLKWKYLPLHLACLQPNPPYEVIESLVRTHPAAVKRRDHKNNLPLHHICRASATSAAFSSWRDAASSRDEVQRVVNLLLRVYPESVYETDGQERTAMDLITEATEAQGANVHSEAIANVLKAYINSTKESLVVNRSRESGRQEEMDGVVLDHDNKDIDDDRESTGSWSSSIGMQNSRKTEPTATEESVSTTRSSIRSTSKTSLHLIISELESKLTQANSDKESMMNNYARMRKENFSCKQELKEMNLLFKNTRKSEIEGRKKIEGLAQKLHMATNAYEACKEKMEEQKQRFDEGHSSAISDLKLTTEQIQEAYEGKLSKHQAHTVHLVKRHNMAMEALKGSAQRESEAYELKLAKTESQTAELVQRLQESVSKEHGLRSQVSMLEGRLSNASKNSKEDASYFLAAKGVIESEKSKLVDVINELERSKKSCQQQNADLIERLENSKVDIECLNEKISELTSENESYQATMQGLSEANEAIQERSNSLQGTMTQRNISFQERLREIVDDNKAMKAENDQLSRQIYELAEFDEENKIKVDELTKKLIAMEGDHDQLLASYNNLQEIRTREIQNVQEKDQTMQATTIALKDAFDRTKIEYEEIIEKLEISVQQLTNEKDTLSLELDEAHNSFSSYKISSERRENELVHKLKSIESDIATVKGALDSTRNEYEAALERMGVEQEKLQSENSELRPKLDELIDVQKLLESDNAALKSTLENTRNEYEETFERMDTEHQQLQNENAALRVKLDEVGTSLKAYKETTRELSGKVNANNENYLILEDLESNLQNVQSANHSLRSQLSEQQQLSQTQAASLKTQMEDQKLLEDENRALRAKLDSICADLAACKTTIQNLSEKLHGSKNRALIIDEMETNVDNLKKENYSLQSEHKQLKDKLMRLEEDDKENSSRLRDATQNEERLLHENKVLRQKIGELTSSNIDATHNEEQLLHDNKALRQKIGELTSSNREQPDAEEENELERKLEHENHSLRRQLEELANRNAACVDRIVRLESIKRHENEGALIVEQMKQKQERLLKENSILKDKLRNIISGAAKDEESTNYSSSTTEVTQSHDQCRAEILALTEKRDALQKKYDTLKDIITRNNEAYQGKMKEMSEMQKSVEKENHSLRLKWINNMNEKMGTYGDGGQNIQSNEQLRMTRELTEQITAYQSKLQDLNAKYDAVRGKNNELKEIINKNNSTYKMKATELQNEKDSLKAMNECLQNTIDTMRRSYMKHRELQRDLTQEHKQQMPGKAMPSGSTSVTCSVNVDELMERVEKIADAKVVASSSTIRTSN